MKKINSSTEKNLNPKTSDEYYWDYNKVNNELEKLIDQREALYRKKGFFYHDYFVSNMFKKPIELTTLTEEDVYYKSSKKMEALSDKFRDIEDENVINMFTGFFDLFLKSPSSYTLLSDLIDIYNSDLKAMKYRHGYKVSLEDDKKIELLKRSFDIFSHLLKRDEILETIIKNNREKLPYILLNEDIFLYYLKDYSELLINKKQLIMENISSQLKDNQR
ncbi:MAG: hypothetical protein ACI4N3_05020 [Alphaproteobacteria bacterium]